MYMDAIIKNAILYITNLMHVNVFSMERGEEWFCLPSPYASEGENRIVRNLMKGAADQSVVYLTDGHYYSYCMIFVSDQVVFLGPYLESMGKRKGATGRELERLIKTKAEAQHYQTMVLLAREEVKAAAYTLILSVYGSTENIRETAVNLEKYQIENWYDVEDETEEKEYPSESARILSSCFMKQIEKGDYLSAAAAYHKIMQQLPKYRKFILIHTVEGLSTIRTLTTLAAQQAGVSQAELDVVMESFKGKARVVTSKEEAIELCCHMISDICELVRSCRLEQYSKEIREAVGYIDSHLKEALTVSTLAKKIGLSPNRLSTKFHEETGATVTGYIKCQRLNEAAVFLEVSGLSVQEIGARVGYLDSNYFARCFKKTYGMSPTDYRKIKILNEAPEKKKNVKT